MSTSPLMRKVVATSARASFTLTLLLTLLLGAVAISAQSQSESFDDLTQDQTADAGSAACTYSLSPAAQSFAAGGGTGSIAVTAAPGCRWTARSSAPWIDITSANSGTGDGTVTFSVDPATNSPRSGTLTIAGKIFNVWQEFNSCGAPVFKATRKYPIASAPTQLVTADFNRDGKPDLAALQTFSGENNISLFLNNGMSGFDAEKAIPAGTYAQHLSTADINKDGNADLLATDLRFVQIFYGDGTGGFSNPKNIRVTTDIHYAAHPGDFNRDGKSDLAVSYRDPHREYEDYVAVLLGDGTGRFTRTSTFIKGSVAAIADINNDNKQDLAVGFSISGFSVYLGDGTGTFGQQIVTEVEQDYGNYQIIDMNGDSQPDLVSGVGVHLGDKTGHFGSLIRIPSLSRDLQFVTVGDFNSDSKPDIGGSSPDGKFAVALGDGTGKVTAPVYYSAVGRPFNIVSVDFNGDRQVDLAAAAHESGLSVLLNGCHAEPPIKISGRMTKENGGGRSGYLTLSSPRIGTIYTHSNATGVYSFTDLDKNDVYTINAYSDPYDFTPRTITNPTTDQVVNFKGVLKNFRITGKIMEYPNANGIGGVTIELSGGRTATTQTDVNGNYSFDNLPALKSYTITVPPSTICSVQGYPYTISSLGTDRVVDYWANRQTYGISGYVKNGSAGVASVKVVLTSPSPAGFAPRTVTTSAMGRYFFSNLPAGRTYIVKATKTNYTITPSSTTYTFLSAEQTTGNFAATPR